MSGFHNFVLVYSWFCDRALMLPSCLVFLWAWLWVCSSRTLSLLRLASCWSVAFGSRHSCLVQALLWFSWRGLDTHAPSFILLWEREVSSSLGLCAPLSMSVLFCSARGSVSASCFFVVLFCCTLACVFSLAAYLHVCHDLFPGYRVLFCTWPVICFAGHVLVFLFCESTWLVLFFCMCHVLACPLSSCPPIL